MADVRPVKPGIYSKIVDAQPIEERDGVYIDSPYFAQKKSGSSGFFYATYCRQHKRNI